MFFNPDHQPARQQSVGHPVHRFGRPGLRRGVRAQRDPAAVPPRPRVHPTSGPTMKRSQKKQALSGTVCARVFRKCDFFVLTKKIVCKTPCVQAVKCCLADLAVSVGSWSPEAVQWLREKVLNTSDCSIKVT